MRDAVLELSYPPPVREPDLSMPLPDLPSDEPQATEEEPLPPVQTPAASPAGALSDFWGRSGGSF